MTYINPLDLKTIFVDTVAGNWTIFLFLSIIAMSIAAARFRMNSFLFGIMICLFAVLLAPWTSWFYTMVVIFAGLAIFFVIARIVKT